MLWFMRGDAISDELIEIVHGESFDKSAAAAPFDDKSFRLQMIQCPFDRHFAGLIDLFPILRSVAADHPVGRCLV